MTPCTLQRKLAAENTSFQKLLDNVRSNLAIEYLLTTRHSIEGIAAQLGFNDTAAFSKAFKRWKGIGPKCYRNQGSEAARQMRE